MSEVGERHLREKLKSLQAWMEEQLTLGLMDLEKTPAGFDRKMYALNKLANEKNSLTTTCFHCSAPLTAKRITEDHVRWWCNESCLKDYNKEEDSALNKEEHY